MSDEFTRKVLTSVVAQVCCQLGWHSINATPLDILVDLLHRHLTQISGQTHRYAEQCKCPQLTEKAHFNRYLFIQSIRRSLTWITWDWPSKTWAFRFKNSKILFKMWTAHRLASTCPSTLYPKTAISTFSSLAVKRSCIDRFMSTSICLRCTQNSRVRI